MADRQPINILGMTRFRDLYAGLASKTPGETSEPRAISAYVPTRNGMLTIDVIPRLATPEAPSLDSGLLYDSRGEFIRTGFVFGSQKNIDSIVAGQDDANLAMELSFDPDNPVVEFKDLDGKPVTMDVRDISKYEGMMYGNAYYAFARPNEAHTELETQFESFGIGSMVHPSAWTPADVGGQKYELCVSDDVISNMSKARIVGVSLIGRVPEETVKAREMNAYQRGSDFGFQTGIDSMKAEIEALRKQVADLTATNEALRAGGKAIATPAVEARHTMDSVVIPTADHLKQQPTQPVANAAKPEPSATPKQAAPAASATMPAPVQPAVSGEHTGANRAPRQRTKPKVENPATPGDGDLVSAKLYLKRGRYGTTQAFVSLPDDPNPALVFLRNSYLEASNIDLSKIPAGGNTKAAMFDVKVNSNDQFEAKRPLGHGKGYSDPFVITGEDLAKSQSIYFANHPRSEMDRASSKNVDPNLEVANEAQATATMTKPSGPDTPGE